MDNKIVDITEKELAGMKNIALKYGFKFVRTSDGAELMAKNTDRCWIPWIRYTIIKGDENKVTLIGNTDNLNLWLYDTRPDLTPELLVEFVRALNKTFGWNNTNEGYKLSQLIDPEDWQEIADISDAYSDKRYTGK